MTKSPKEKKTGMLKSYYWRVAAVFLTNAIASVLITQVNGAPMPIPEVFVHLFLSLIIWPTLGLPIILFTIWWVVDRRIPLFVLLLVYAIPVVIIYMGVKSRSEADERQKANSQRIEEMMKEDFHQEYEE